MTTYRSSFDLSPQEIKEELDLQWKDERKQQENYNPNAEFNALRDITEYRFE